MSQFLRRWAAGLGGAGLALAAAGGAMAEELRLVTPQGPLAGEITADGAVGVFKGIPYATPPVGARRWKPAEPAPDWTNLRLATRPGPVCVQSSLPPTVDIPGGGRQASLYWDADQVSSEDCLYLNVWTPVAAATDKAGPRPVMVWIHGGAFLNGSGINPAYDGAALARKGAVVVTINYRLGIFGFFAHPELSAESPTGTSGNQGLTDQIEALRWVKRNIAAFGGDPNNVTIFGESAGGWAISLLVANRRTEGLFHKAIGESGAYFYSMLDLRKPTQGRPSAEDVGLKFARQAVPGGGLDALRGLTAADLQKAADRPGAINPGLFVIVDGVMFKRPVRDIFALGEQRAVPVLVGFNADEGSGLSDFYVVPPPPPTARAYVEQVEARFGDLAPAWLKQYPASDLTAAVFDAYRDSEFGWRMQAWAGDMSKVGAPAWLYYFAHTPPAGEAMRALPAALGSTALRRGGAFHASEIAYAFNNPDVSVGSTLPPTPVDRRLAEEMSDYWVTFARSGDPNGAGRPLWSPYRPADRRYMRFDKVTTPGVDPLPGSLELHRQIDERRFEAGIAWDGGSAGLLATLHLPGHPLGAE